MRFLGGVDEAVALLSQSDERGLQRSRCFVVPPGASGTRPTRELRGLVALAEQVPLTSAVCCDPSVLARCTWQLASHHHTLRLEIRRRARLTAVLSPERWVELTPPSWVRPRGPSLPARSRLPDLGAEEAPSAADERSSPPGRGAAGVEIDFLGPVQIIGATHQLERRRRMTELIVYLAFHDEGVTGESLATALWPDRKVALQTVSNRLHEARRALGTAADGRPRLRRIDGRHRLAGDVRSDWGLFVSLTGARSGPADWHQALCLVRGRPFDGLSRGDWVGLEGAAARIETAVSEVAARLGEHLLDNGDPAGAMWAARKGIAAAPWEEHLYRLLMRAADAAGSRGAVESALRRLAKALDWKGDPLEAVHPATAVLYRELTGPPSGPEGSEAGRRPSPPPTRPGR